MLEFLGEEMTNIRSYLILHVIMQVGNSQKNEQDITGWRKRVPTDM